MTQVLASHYQIQELIGQGGMGEVYRAEDVRDQTPVAIKALKPEVLSIDPNLLERFLREGQMLRRLNHPNIVKMLDAFAEGQRQYLVMEYVPGGSLRDVLRQTPQLPVPRVLAIALELADALTRAHHLRVVHRDIKPANILLAEDGTPRLTDFGVAHMEDLPAVTQTGATVGTFAYLSPEACRGEVLDERTDLWSFGVLLYEMLSGRNPFDKGMPAATITAILNDVPPPLDTLRLDVPPRLAVLVNQMLAKEKAGRTPSARMVGAELEAIIRGYDTPTREQIAQVPAENEPSRFDTPPTRSGGAQFAFNFGWGNQDEAAAEAELDRDETPDKKEGKGFQVRLNAEVDGLDFLKKKLKFNPENQGQEAGDWAAGFQKADVRKSKDDPDPRKSKDDDTQGEGEAYYMPGLNTPLYIPQVVSQVDVGPILVREGKGGESFVRVGPLISVWDDGKGHTMVRSGLVHVTDMGNGERKVVRVNSLGMAMVLALLVVPGLLCIGLLSLLISFL
ncbi:MAG: serine/threonine protein kinase [Anaerolineae bacterium]|nr:serine/threonine protein kinase [Anaerolineae bacterium]